jgi:prolyl-tRNA synthetase
LDEVSARAPGLLEAMQASLLAEATRRLADATHDVASIDEAIEAAETGFARLAWSQVGPTGEAALKVHAITVRCLQRRDATMPLAETEPDLDCIVAKSY